MQSHSSLSTTCKCLLKSDRSRGRVLLDRLLAAELLLANITYPKKTHSDVIAWERHDDPTWVLQ